MDDSDFIPTSLKPSMPYVASSSHETVCSKTLKPKINKGVSIESDHLLPHSNDDRCYICNKDLSHLNEIRKSLHINSCLDNQEANDKLSSDKTKWANTLDCPMCGEPLQPGPYRASHAKRCGKKHNVSATRLLILMETQSKIAEMKRKAGVVHTKLAQPKLEIKKPARLKEEPRSAFQEQMRLAMAMSASLNTAADESFEKRTHKDAQTVKQNKKSSRTSYSFYELEPRSCKCAVFEQIQENFINRFKVKHYKNFGEMVKSRLKRSSVLLGDINKCIRKLQRLERLADDYGRYAEVGGDTSVLCRNGEILLTHRFILNARAPKLAALLDDSGFIKLDKYSASSLRCYLHFLSTSKMEWTRAEEPEVLKLADDYGPRELVILLKKEVDIIKGNISSNCERNLAASVASCTKLHSLNSKIEPGGSEEHQEVSGSSAFKTSDSSDGQCNNFVQNDVNMDAEHCPNAENIGNTEGLNNEDDTVIVLDDTCETTLADNVLKSDCQEGNEFRSNFQKTDALMSNEMLNDGIGEGNRDIADVSAPAAKTADRIGVDVENDDNDDARSTQPLENCNLYASPDVFYLSSDDEQDNQKCLEIEEKDQQKSPNVDQKYCVGQDPCSDKAFDAIQSPVVKGDVDEDELMIGIGEFPENCFSSPKNPGQLRHRLDPLQNGNAQSLTVEMVHEFFVKRNGLLLSPITGEGSSSGVGTGVIASENIERPTVQSKCISEEKYGNDFTVEKFKPKEVNHRTRKHVSDKVEVPCTSTPLKELTKDTIIGKRLKELGSNVKVIKTTDITPMPQYECMNEKELKEELAKYGVRPLGKKKAVAILKRIYEQTHPFIIMDSSPVSSRISDKADTVERSSPERLPHRVLFDDRFEQEEEEGILADCTLNLSLEEDQIREESAVDLMDDEGDCCTGDEIRDVGTDQCNIDQEPLPKDIDGMQRALLRWLRRSDNAQLYNHLLTLNPISFEEFYDQLLSGDSAAAAIPKKALIEILDRLHITFRLPDDGWKRKNQKLKLKQQKRKEKL